MSHESVPADADDTAEQQAARTAMFSGMRVVSLLTMISRVTGLARDSLMAGLFGNGPIMDAFTVAFRIPNLARRLFGEGALTAAFLPALVREMEQRGRESAWQLASGLFSFLALVLLAIVLAIEAGLWLLSTVSPSAETQLLLGLTATMAPYLLVICLAAQISAVMHALNHFVWPALISVLLNLVWIAGILFVAPRFESPEAQAYAIGAVIVLGGVLQFAVPLWPLRRLGFRFHAGWWRSANPARERTVAGIRGIARTMMPILLGLSITQFNAALDSFLAWWFAAPEPTTGAWASLEPGTAAALYLGQRMYQFPLGVLGIALGTVLFPRLAQHSERGRRDLLRADLELGLRLVIVIGVPAAAGLLLLAEPLTDLLFRHGRFDAGDARQTATMIRGYGCAVWAYCALLILNRAFYAIDDQRTPLRAGLWAMVLNLLLNLGLIRFVGGVGLALGTALTSMAQCGLVLWLLQKRIGRIDGVACRSTGVRTVLATALMSTACAATLALLPAATAAGSTRVLRVALPFAAAVIAYFVAARLLRLREVDVLLGRRQTPANADDSI